MTALVARERYGVGQKVNTSGYGAQIWLQMWELTHSSMTGKALSRNGDHLPNIPGMYGIYETKGGEFLFPWHSRSTKPRGWRCVASSTSRSSLPIRAGTARRCVSAWPTRTSTTTICGRGSRPSSSASP